MKAAVIGLGDILSGDMGAGCCVLEMLAQEIPEGALAFHYLARDAQYIGAFIFGVPYAVIVQALPFGGLPGRTYCWGLQAFRQNIRYWANRCEPLVQLGCAMARTELASGLPQEVLFVWIEPERTDGVGLSGTARRAARQSTQIIKDWLYNKGVISITALNLRAFYRFDYFESCSNLSIPHN